MANTIEQPTKDGFQNSRNDTGCAIHTITINFKMNKILNIRFDFPNDVEFMGSFTFPASENYFPLFTPLPVKMYQLYLRTNKTYSFEWFWDIFVNGLPKTEFGTV